MRFKKLSFFVSFTLILPVPAGAFPALEAREANAIERPRLRKAKTQLEEKLISERTYIAAYKEVYESSGGSSAIISGKKSIYEFARAFDEFLDHPSDAASEAGSYIGLLGVFSGILFIAKGALERESGCIKGGLVILGVVATIYLTPHFVTHMMDLKMGDYEYLERTPPIEAANRARNAELKTIPELEQQLKNIENELKTSEIIIQKGEILGSLN